MNDHTSDYSVSTASTPTALPFQFRGEGLEYFKIWIVNVLLTVLTLGIYSAWATVRNKRYIYANLFLDGSNFRYLAEPLAILKGRIIAVVAFIAFALLSQSDPIAALVLTVILLLVAPLLINKSLAFNRRMSTYNNIQFRFKGTYLEAFMVLYVWPLLAVLTLGILYPLALLKIHQYQVKNSAYGTSKFDFHASYRDYAMICLPLVATALLLTLLSIVMVSLVPVMAAINPVIMVFVYLGLILYFMTQTSNLFFRSITLKSHSFSADITMTGLAKVLVINTMLTILTLGLYLPAAKVRMMKYVCSYLTMHATDRLDNFSTAEQANISALGEELGQIFDVAV